MKTVFTVGEGFQVPDGTVVRPIMDPCAVLREGSTLVDDLSLAFGEIPPSTDSRIHLHPVVSQLTWVVAGELTVKMKEPALDAPYTLELLAREAIVTRAGTFFQLINRASFTCQTLYFVTPAFVFETDENGDVVYNDAVVLDQSWEELAASGWSVPELDDLSDCREKRELALQRARARKPSQYPVHRL